jgi:hypothetical protein
VDIRYTSEHKSVQVIGYADDTNILERSLRNIRGRFEELDIAGEDVR